MEAALNGPQGRVTLSPQPLRLGRAPDNSLVVSDLQSSSHHAEIKPGPDGASYTVTDLGSTNGTFINEQPLTPHVPQTLRAGDVIRIGSTHFNYEVAGAIDPTVRASGPSYDSTAYAGPSGASSSSPSYGTPAPAYGVPPSAPSYGMPSQPGYQPQVPSYNPPPSPMGYPVQAGYPASSAPGYPSAQPGYPSAQPGYAPMPGAMGMPGYQPPQRSRTGLWITLVVVAVLVVGGGIFGVVYANRSTPQKTLDAMCAAFQNGDGHSFYGLLSDHVKTKSNIQESDVTKLFAEIQTVGGIKSCTYNNVQENGSTATATYTIQWNNAELNSQSGGSDTIYLLDENGTWKLDSNPNSSSNGNNL